MIPATTTEGITAQITTTETTVLRTVMIPTAIIIIRNKDNRNSSKGRKMSTK
jgi:hypothetical protein